MIKRIFLINIMILGIIMTMGNGFAASSKDTTTVVTTTTTSTSKTVMASPVERPKYFYESKGKSDPMDVPWYHKTASGGPSTGSGEKVEEIQINVQDQLKGQVSGIVYCETNPVGSLALVGDKVVKIGDTVKIALLPKSAKIVKIDKKEVILSYEGKTYPVKVTGS